MSNQINKNQVLKNQIQ